MVAKKTLVTAVLATFCLASALFIAVPTKSQDGATSSNEYDPWIDTNDDGIIDIFDIAALALAFGAEGTPINKTAILIDLQDRVSVLEEKNRQTKWIRFYDPTEYLSSTTPPLGGPKDKVTFVWTPNNGTSNAMLSMCCYFQYYTDGIDPMHPVTIGLKLDGRETTPVVAEVPIYEFGWSRIFYDSEFTWASNPYSSRIACLIPNSPNHTITLQLYDIGYDTAAHVKDINILLEVMDGLPPS